MSKRSRKNKHSTYATQPSLWLSSTASGSCSKPFAACHTPVAPIVYYREQAWVKIQSLVHMCKTEVGWLGLVERVGLDYMIEDIIVPDQEVSACTTEISADGINKAVTDLIMQGVDASTLVYWGHSHVNMPVNPSHTDEQQIQAYVDMLPDNKHYIRGIYNKRGDARVDVYEKGAEGQGWIHQLVKNQVEPPKIQKEIYEQLLAEVKANVSVYIPPPLPNRAVAYLTKPDTSFKIGDHPAGQDLMDELSDMGFNDEEAEEMALLELADPHFVYEGH